MNIREMTRADIPEVIALRTRTRENALTLEQLKSLGITEDSVSAMLYTSHRGWVCLEAGTIIGFTMANHDTGELWVIAIHPEYKGRGIGRELMYYAQTWLFNRRWDEVWLTTDIDTSLRAYGFYIRLGWQDMEIKDGIRRMTLKNPNPPERHISFLRNASKYFH